ncbi:hypothetical protein [Aneurinibacillus tyrosinisolvens]|uniref:hypothetical protein n=1 Tax=Aneurinibacillus tyrosinisolvens TaxID=1443435 RepID=UPI00069B7CB4|nr:hypothetical protein [Aneurinibacillus tyrosinisolvens]
MKDSFFLVFLAAAGITAYGMMIGLCGVFRKKGWVSFNYKKTEVPHGCGILFPFCFLLFAGFFPNGATERLVVCAAGICLVGWIDDRMGDKGTKGLRGHFLALWKERRMTTGMLKAVSAFLFAVCAASFFYTAMGDFAVDTLLITLATNAMNLLDLRPGRALKGFWLLQSLCLTAGTIPAALAPFTYYVLLLTVIMAPFDFSAKAMLGDSGANLLGFLAGALCAYSLNLYVKIILLVLLLVLHYYAERASISAAIENNRFLRRMDAWGRSG